MVTTMTNKDVKTRKEHQCAFCFEKFPKGTTMTYATYIFEGQWFSQYSCMDCNDLLHEFENEFVGSDDGVEEGAIANAMQEHNCDTKKELRTVLRMYRQKEKEFKEKINAIRSGNI